MSAQVRRYHQRSLGLGLLALLLVGGTRASGGTPTNGSPLRLGFLVPPETSQADTLRAAAQLAALSASDRALPPVQLIVRGRAGQWGDDGTEAAQLAINDAVFGLITPPDGTATHLVLQVAGRTAVPVVSLCPDTSVLGSGIPWLVQIVPDTVRQASSLLADLLASPSSPVAWSAIIPPGRAGRETAHDLRQAAAAYPHLTLTPRENPSNPKEQARLAKDLVANPSALTLLWLPPEQAGAWAYRLRHLGYRGALAGPYYLQSSLFLQAAGDAAEGFHIPTLSPKPSRSPEFGDFESAFLEQLGRPPDALAACTHDAVLLLRALAHPSVASPRDSTPTFTNLPPLSGLTGPLVFDNTGLRQGPLVVSSWLDHRWKSSEPSHNVPSPQ